MSNTTNDYDDLAPEGSYDPDHPSKLEMATAFLTGRASSTYVGALQSCTLRVPSHMIFEIDAFVTQSGQSRNRVMLELIEVGLTAVKNMMTEEELERHRVLNNENARAFIKDHVEDGKPCESGEI